MVGQGRKGTVCTTFIAGNCWENQCEGWVWEQSRKTFCREFVCAGSWILLWLSSSWSFPGTVPGMLQPLQGCLSPYPAQGKCLIPKTLPCLVHRVQAHFFWSQSQLWGLRTCRRAQLCPHNVCREMKLYFPFTAPHSRCQCMQLSKAPLQHLANQSNILQPCLFYMAHIYYNRISTGREQPVQQCGYCK